MSASNVPAAEIQAMNKRALLICTPQVGTLFRCSKYGVGIVRQVTRDPACSCLPSKKIPQSTPRLGKESQKTTPWLSKPSKSHPSNSHSVNPPSKNISRNAECAIALAASPKSWLQDLLAIWKECWKRSCPAKFGERKRAVSFPSSHSARKRLKICAVHFNRSNARAQMWKSSSIPIPANWLTPTRL